MRPVFSDQEPARVGYFQSVLENAGIPAFIRNQHTNTTMTGMPSGLFFPVLCVVNDDDFEKAKSLITEIRDSTQSDALEWVCSACNESVPGNFDICWKCGAERAGPSASS